MKKTIRLYRRHDMDLLVLYKNKNFNFQKALKRSLYAYMNNQPIKYKTPDIPKEMNNFEFKYAYQCFLYLDEETDKELIAFLDNIKPKMFNAFCKSVLRGSLVGNYAFICLKELDSNVNDILNSEADKTEIKVEPPIPKKFDKKKKKITPKKEDKELKKLKEQKEQKEQKKESESPKVKAKVETPVKPTVTEAAVMPKPKENDDDFDLFGSVDSLNAMF